MPMRTFLSLAIPFSCAIFIASFSMAQAETSKVMVTVSSSYEDQSTFKENKQKKHVKGSGFLVTGFGKSFVVTAAHVGSGENPQITSGKDLLKITGSLYDGIRDVQVFEVESSNYPAMVIKEGSYIEWTPEANARRKSVDSFNFVLLNDWVSDPHLSQDNTYSALKKEALNCDMLCVLLQSDVILQPGSSGSPLLTKLASRDLNSSEDTLLPYDLREGLPEKNLGAFILRGMSIKRERFFSRTSFIPSYEIIAAIKNYVKGARTKDPLFTWNVSGGLMYRTKKDFSESSVISYSVGNSVSMDGGELASYNEDNPSAMLENLTSFPMNQGKESLYWYFNYNGPNFELFMVGPIWFSLEHYAYFSSNRSKNFFGYSDALVYNSLGEFLAKKLYRLSTPLDGFGITDNGIEVKIKTAEKSILNFTIGRSGQICDLSIRKCHKNMEPISEIKDSKGASYIVDIRDLLFINLENIRSDLFRKESARGISPKEAYELTIKGLIQEYRRFKVHYRKKRMTTTPMTTEEGQVQTKVWDISN